MNCSFLGRGSGCWGTVKERGKEVSLVTSRVPMLRILLTNTKVPRSTKVLVAGVKEKILKVRRLPGCGVGDVCWCRVGR